jgi:hypothetical protein
MKTINEINDLLIEINKKLQKLLKTSNFRLKCFTVDFDTENNPSIVIFLENNEGIWILGEEEND